MRSELFDGRILPVENLATNPSFERVTPGTTVVRRNLHPNPSGKNTASWSGYVAGGSFSVSRPNTGGPLTGAQSWVRVDFSAPPTASPASIATSTSSGSYSIAVVPGRTYTMSGYAISSWTGYSGVRIDIQWYNSLGTQVGNESSAQPTLTTSDTWERRSKTVIAPADAAYAFLLLAFSSPTSMPAGTYIGATAMLVEERPAAMPYFDGSTVDNTAIAYSWEGTANASTSLAKAGAVEVMRNYFRDPGARGNVAYSFSFWAGASATSTMSVISSSWSRSGRAMRATRTSAAGSVETIGITLNGIGLIVGNTYTIEYDIVTSRAASLGQIGSFVGATNTGWTIITSSPAATTTAGTPSHVWATFSVGSGGDARICAPWSGQQSDDWSEISNITIYAGTKQATFSYFDGSITPDTDLAPVWIGTENNSASILYGTSLYGIASAANAFAICSSIWSSSGRWSLRLIPRSSSSDSYPLLGGDANNGFTLGMQPGHSYTAIGRLRVTAPQTGTLQSKARTITAFWKKADGNYNSGVISQSAPNSQGVTTIRLTFTIPPDATEAFVRLYNGASFGNGDVWWDDLALVEGSYTGPYLDGDMPGCIWRGVPHASTSVGYSSNVA